MISELSAEAAEKLLSEQNFGHLGCVLETGEPYVVPVNYLFKDQCVYVHSMPGLKIAALRINPKACLQVDLIKGVFDWRSVIAFGEFEEITDKAEREAIFTELFAQFRKLTPVEAMNHGESGEVVLFRIRVSRVTGRMET